MTMLVAVLTIDTFATPVRSSNVEGHGNDMSRSVGLDVGSVVGELVTFAEPDPARCCIVV